MMTAKNKAKGLLKYHKTKEKAIKAVEKQLLKACELPYGLEYLRKSDYLTEVIEEINKL